MDNNMITKKQNTSTNSLTTILLLIISFAWIGIYESFNFSSQGGFWGNVVDFNTTVSALAITNLFTNTLFGWIGFEIICYFYRFLLTFRIYSFVVPQKQLVNYCRKYFIYRNIVYGTFTNICFLFPYLYIFRTFVNVVVTMVMMIYFALNLCKKYSEPIIRHFVFKCFCYPIVIYEAIAVILQIWEVLA